MEKLKVHTNKKTGEVTYHATVRVKGFPRHCDSFSTAAAAIEFQKTTTKRLLKQRAETSDPTSWLPTGGQLADQKLRDVLARYQTTFARSDWHFPTINATLNVCRNPTIGQLYPSWIKDYILRARKTITIRGKPYAWKSIKQQLSCISTAIKWTAEQLNINPPPFVVTEKAFVDACKAEGLRKEDIENERDRRFEPGEEDRLMMHLSESDEHDAEQWKLFVQFAIHTGARLQEIALAKWSEICPSGEWWHIPGSQSKTKSRTLVLVDEAMDVLDRMRALRDPTNKRIFHGLGKPKALSKRWAKDARKANLQGFVFHDLRHEGISRLVINQPNIPIKALMTMVGHSSIKMLDRYAKLRPNELAPLVRRRSDRATPNPATTAPRQPSGPTGGFACRHRRFQLAREGAQATSGLTPSPSNSASTSS